MCVYLGVAGAVIGLDDRQAQGCDPLHRPPRLRDQTSTVRQPILDEIDRGCLVCVCVLCVCVCGTQKTKI